MDYIFVPDNMVAISTAITFAGVLVAVLLIWIATRSPLPSRRIREFQARAMDLETAIDRLTVTQKELSDRLHSLADRDLVNQASSLRRMEDRLDDVAGRTGSSLKENARLTSASLANMSDRLSAIGEAGRVISDGAPVAATLKEMLTSSLRGGPDGEVALADLIAATLPAGTVTSDVSLSTGATGDLVVTLPGAAGSLVLDAGFPGNAFQDLIQSGSAEEYEANSATFRETVAGHIAHVATKIATADEANGGVLLFVPDEAVFAALHGEFTELVEAAEEAGISMVSPATLQVVLKALRTVSAGAALAEQAGRIETELAAATSELAQLKTGIGNIERSADDVERDLRSVLAAREETDESISIPDSSMIDDVTPDPKVVAPKMKRNAKSNTRSGLSAVSAVGKAPA